MHDSAIVKVLNEMNEHVTHITEQAVGMQSRCRSPAAFVR